MIRVMLLDDHLIVREGVRRVLGTQSDMQITAEASRGEEALFLLGQIACDVLVMDLAMPGLHGRELVEQVREVYPTLGIVVFSMYPEDPFALYFLQCGVNAFVTKERQPGDLVEAIRLAAQGKCFLPRRLRMNQTGSEANPGALEIATMQDPMPFGLKVETADRPKSPDETAEFSGKLWLGPVAIDMQGGQVQHPSGDTLLSVHELGLLKYLAERAGQTLSRNDLLRQVWGYSSRAQTRTVEMTISRLRRKIEIDATNPRFILTIHGEGYRLDRNGA